MTDNVINMSEWLKQKRLSKLKQMWFWYPIRDENEPLGWRFELVEAIPLEPRVHRASDLPRRCPQVSQRIRFNST